MVALTLPTPLNNKLNSSITTGSNVRNRNSLMDDENFMYVGSTTTGTQPGDMAPHQTSSPSTVTAQALLPRGMTIRVIDALLTSESPQINTENQTNAQDTNTNATETTTNAVPKLTRGETPPPAFRNRSTRAIRNNNLVTGPNLSVVSTNASLPTDTDFAFVPTPINTSRINGMNTMHAVNSAFMGTIREPLSTGLGLHFGPPLSVSMGMTVPGSVGIGLPSGISTNYPHSALPNPNNLTNIISQHSQYTVPMSVGIFSTMGLQAPLSTGFGLGTNGSLNNNSITSSTSMHSSQLSNLEVSGSSLSSDGLGRYVIGKRRSRVNPSDADLPRPAQDFEAAIMSEPNMNDNGSTVSSSLNLFSPFVNRSSNNTETMENVPTNSTEIRTITPASITTEDNMATSTTTSNTNANSSDELSSIGMNFSLSTAVSEHTLMSSSTNNSLNIYNPSASSTTKVNVFSPAANKTNSAMKKMEGGHKMFSPTKGSSFSFYPEVMKVQDIPSKTGNINNKENTMVDDEDTLSLSRLGTSQIGSSNNNAMNVEMDPSSLTSSGIYNNSNGNETVKMTIHDLSTTAT